MKIHLAVGYLLAVGAVLALANESYAEDGLEIDPAEIYYNVFRHGNTANVEDAVMVEGLKPAGIVDPRWADTADWHGMSNCYLADPDALHNMGIEIGPHSHGVGVLGQDLIDAGAVPFINTHGDVEVMTPRDYIVPPERLTRISELAREGHLPQTGVTPGRGPGTSVPDVDSPHVATPRAPTQAPRNPRLPAGTGRVLGSGLAVAGVALDLYGQEQLINEATNGDPSWDDHASAILATTVSVTSGVPVQAYVPTYDQRAHWYTDVNGARVLGFVENGYSYNKMGDWSPATYTELLAGIANGMVEPLTDAAGGLLRPLF